MRVPRSIPALLIALGAPAVPAWAQDVPDLSADRITIGVGPAFVPRYVGSDRMTVVPGIAAQGQVSHRSFETAGTSLSVDLIPDADKPGWKFQAGPMFNLRLDRTARIAEPQVAALGTRKTAWEPGAWIGLQRTGVMTSPYDSLSASISWQHDVSGAYDGSVVSPAISYDTPLSHHDYVSLSAGADHVGKRFGRYYYDIDDAGSAASGLGVYDGADKAGWKDWNLDLLTMHMVRGELTRGVGVFGTLGYSRLVGAHARSPIVADVGSANQWSGAIGVSITL